MLDETYLTGSTFLMDVFILSLTVPINVFKTSGGTVIYIVCFVTEERGENSHWKYLLRNLNLYFIDTVIMALNVGTKKGSGIIFKLDLVILL